MRGVIYAEIFVEDADRIASYIEKHFGASRADVFINDLNHFCQLIANQPGIGKYNHGYETTLHGVVHERNWIFFQHDETEVRFIHIFDGRRRRDGMVF